MRVIDRMEQNQTIDEYKNRESRGRIPLSPAMPRAPQFTAYSLPSNPHGASRTTQPRSAPTTQRRLTPTRGSHGRAITRSRSRRDDSRHIQGEYSAGIYPTVNNADTNSVGYVTWTFQDPDTFASNLPNLQKGADKWIREVEIGRASCRERV